MLSPLVSPLLSAALAATLTTASRVEQVVLYPDRAQVTRVARIACGPKSLVTFEALPPAAEAGSFRARSDRATIAGLRSETRTREAQYAPELKGLTAALRAQELELRALQDEKAKSQKLADTGQRYGEVATALLSKELTAPKPDPKSWATALDLSLSSRLTAAQKQAELGAKEREAQKKLEQLQRQQGRLAAASQRREQVVEVIASCPSGGEARVELSYLVGGASWRPQYEARAEESAGAVELSTFATVSQSTGEKWTDAHLTLSTAVPTDNATPPELSPLRVYSESRAEEKKVLVAREERVEHALAPGEAAEPSAGKGLLARAQGLSVQLEVPRPADVPGDGSPVRLFVGATRMKATFSYRAVPKLMPHVFRVAQVKSSAPYPLLPGPLDAFRQQGFMGKYALERVPQGGLFQLTFGAEETLRVERQVVEEVKREAGLFGNKRRFLYGYRFELANHGGAAREVEVAEHIPVSELEDVTVSLDAKTSAGHALEKSDGIVTWKVPLKPGDKKRLELSYRVEVPSSYDTGGL